MSKLQHLRAWQLASKFGHEWAQIIAPNPYWQRSFLQYHVDELSGAWCTLARARAQEALASIHAGDGGCLDYQIAVEAGRDLLANKLGQRGIDPPFVHEVGTDEIVALHSTATGRVRWMIRRDGTTAITVSRPEGDVLRATVGIVGSPSECCVLERLNPRIPLWIRHLISLQHALSALDVVIDLPIEIVDHSTLAAQENAAKAAHEEAERVAKIMATIDHWEDRAEQEGYTS